MNKAVKIKNVYKIMVKPVVVYGSETWSMMGMKRLKNTQERKILRRIYGPVEE
jgi:hypothetical protein